MAEETHLDSIGRHLTIYDRTSFKRQIICGVYCILNTQTGETYVGCSRDINRRITRHLTTIKYGWGNTKFSQAIRTFGQDSFVFVILEECPETEIYQRETYWIKNLCPEYNVLSGGSLNNKGIPMPLEQRTQISITMKRKVKLQTQHSDG